MKSKIRKFFRPLISLFAILRIHPNILTSLHLILGGVSAYFVYRKQFEIGGILFLVSSMFDFFDGAVAEFSHKKSASGAIYDSVSDRIQEGIVLFSLLLSTPYGALCFLAMLSGFLISYVRARAESEGIEAKVGIFTRTVRSLILGTIIIFKIFPWGLYILIIGNTLTFIHRFTYAFIRGRKSKK